MALGRETGEKLDGRILYVGGKKISKKSIRERRTRDREMTALTETSSSRHARNERVRRAHWTAVVRRRRRSVITRIAIVVAAAAAAAAMVRALAHTSRWCRLPSRGAIYIFYPPFVAVATAARTNDEPGGGGDGGDEKNVGRAGFDATAAAAY